jgi:hypothetical protein
MFIANDPTTLQLRSEKRQPHRVSGRTGAAFPNGARSFGKFVAINLPLLRSENNAKARVGFVLLVGELR